MRIKPNIAAMTAYKPGRQFPGSVKLSSNENPLGPSPKVMKVVRRALAHMHRYPDGSSPLLRKALAENWQVKPEQVLVANGSDEVFSLLCAAWIGPGDNAITALETFSQYSYAVRLFDAKMQHVPLVDGAYDLPSILASVNKRTRFIFLCNPNNPTGRYRNHDELEHFLHRVDKNIIVVLDEAYADFNEASDFPDSRTLLKRYDNLVVTRTFSKINGLAGLRIGYAIGDAVLIAESEKAAMPFRVNSLAQTAALASLEDRKYKKKTLDLLRREKVFLEKSFAQRKIFYHPSQANFFCFRLDGHHHFLWEFIANRGISLRDLESFSLPGMFRYTVGKRKHNEKLLRILDEILDNSQKNQD